MKEKKRKLIGIEFTLLHDKRKPKVIYKKIPKKPAFKDIFNHPCKDYIEKGYYISTVRYNYSIKLEESEV